MNDTADPIDLVRAARHRISESLQHDPAKVIEHYLALQQEYRARLLEVREENPQVEQGGAKPGGPAHKG